MTTEVQEDAITLAMKRAYSTGDTRTFMELVLRVQDKQGSLVPFVLKPAQAAYWTKRSGSDIILKAAQMGFTTEIQGEFFADAMLFPGLEILYVAQRDATAIKLFDITKRFYRSMPNDIAPVLSTDTLHRMTFDFDNGQQSTIEIGSAESGSFGRGRPVHRALFTEVAFYNEDAIRQMNGIIARMPVNNSRYVEESTAYGQSGTFYEHWIGAVAGTNALKPHFFPWFDDPDYFIKQDNLDVWSGELVDLSESEEYLIQQKGLSHDQIRWRRWMRARLGRDFAQEFPETPDEAFLPVGDAVFNYEHLSRVQLDVRDPSQASPDGTMRYWKSPEIGVSYGVLVDQASGEQRDVETNRPIDFQIANVFDERTLEQIACFRGKITQRAFARQIIDLAVAYNDALVCPERNTSQYGFIEMILDLGYSHIYVHTDMKYGYPMNVGTKPVLVDNFADHLAAEGAIIIRSDNLLHEARNYRWLKHRGARGMGAAPGGHDDELVTAFFACDPNVRSQAIVTNLRNAASAVTYSTRGRY